MKPSFLNHSRPLITSMIIKDNPDDTRYAIKNSIYEGADAVAVQLENWKDEFRTEENYKTVFAAAGQRPIYVTCYRNSGLDDEGCMEQLKLALKCGGTLGDVPGDMFDKSKYDYTKNPVAIEKQMRVIDEIHEMGKEALMSCHVLEHLPEEQILEIAYEQQRRGADVVKIVGGSNSYEELHDNLRITSLLKQELKVPFIFISSGTHSKIHRMIGTQLGNFSYFAVLQHDGHAVPTQPTVRAAKHVRDYFDYLPDIIPE